MEELFNNKKELFVGKRIFFCDFLKDGNKRMIETREELEEQLRDEKREDTFVRNDKEKRDNWQKEKENEQKLNWDQENKNENENENENAFEQNKSGDDDEEEKEEEEEEESIDNNLKVYMFNQDVKIKIGTIRFLGNLKNHVSDQTYYGIEWDNEFKGKNKGNFKEVFYFLPLHFLKKKKAQLRHERNGTLQNCEKYQTGDGAKFDSWRNGNETGKDEELLKTCRNVFPCSFVPLQKISVGITFIQALHFRYNYFPELNLSITDYQTEKTKKMLFVGEQKVIKHFQNYLLLENITLNKYLIYECGDVKNICFQNLKSLSLSFNLFSKWTDIFNIIRLAKKLSYINLSNNRFMKLEKEDLFDEEKTSTENKQFPHNSNTKHNANLLCFEHVKELCLDSTMIDWEDIHILSYIFPNLETLSLKRNYLTSIDIKSWETGDNEMIHLYKSNAKYIEMLNRSEEIKEDATISENNNCNKQKRHSWTFFKNLKKIVLNDNYLDSYEELFYFVYKIKSVESIFANNNKFCDSNRLVDIAYTICASEEEKMEKEAKVYDKENSYNVDVVLNGRKEERKCSKENTQVEGAVQKQIMQDQIVKGEKKGDKENQFEFINSQFNHLKEFLFDNNEVKNYETLRDLFYIFYDLEVLKIKNKKNYFKEAKNMRYIFIAILPKLKVLNHSFINKNERINSERFFISLYKRDKIAQLFNEVVLNRRHSTFLEKIHYKANTEEADLEKNKTMQSNLINITIVPEFLDSQQRNVIKKKVNKYMNIKDLKYLCSRLYSISFPKMRLYYTDENSPMSIEILDTNANLYTYGIENNAKIKIQLEE